MDPYEMDETCTRLKDALDIRDLRDPGGDGVEFEVDEDQLNQDDRELDTALDCFDKNQVASNICLMSDDENNDDENTDGDEPYLTEMERLRKKMTKIDGSDITQAKDGGILKQLKSPGVGCTVPEGSLVKFHYNGYTDMGQAPFDSSRLRGDCKKLRLGKGEAIPGLELALLSMKKHEVARFLIRHDYAYGDMGCPPRIPKKATLIFDIEVLHFVEQEGVDDYYSLTMAERRQKLMYPDIEKVCRAENAEGKEYFVNKNYHKALGKYKRAANVLENYQLKNEEEEKLWGKQLLKVYINSAICCHHLKHFGQTIRFCNRALELDKNNVKAHYFKGQALHSLGNFEDSKKSLRRARNLDPVNSAVTKALKALAESMKQHEKFEKDMCRRMFSQPAEAAPPREKEGNDQGKASSSRCSDAFRALVQEQFEKFKNDPLMTEMPFPQFQMTEMEIECILETATNLGMDVKQRGTGNSLRYEVYKKSPPTT